jgi:hypothetical protein
MKRASTQTLSALSLACVILFVFACADEPPVGAGGDTGRVEDLSQDALRDTGVQPDTVFTDESPDEGGAEVGPDVSSDGGADVDDTAPDGPDGGTPDLLGDLGADLATCADNDNDGYNAESCGGRDCDDDNRFVNPGFGEGCDFVDNNCDGQVNEGLNCTFLAHTPDTLYRIDPFLNTAEAVTEAPDLWDMDTDPDGTLYAISEVALYRYNVRRAMWIEITPDVQAPGDTNGMAIDLSGIAYITSGNRLFTLDLETGQTRRVGSMGPGFESSGDIVINKGNSLYMSSRDGSETDYLVLIDAETGRARTVGPIGFNEVYGLTAAWGYLIGVTAKGEVISINSETGEGELLASYPDLAFGGSASAEER